MTKDTTIDGSRFRVKVRGELMEDIQGKLETLKKVARSLQKPGDSVQVTRLE